MLQKEAVEKRTFEFLTALMKDDKLSDFVLVGDTALSLYLGHRISVDLDMFTNKPFDETLTEKYLSGKYNFKRSYGFRHSLLGFINDIKVDFIAHRYPNVEDPLITEDGLRISSLKDIAAMKLSAIADAGTRLKDFIDVAFLSTRLSFEEMLDAYTKKYDSPEKLRPVRGLTFFEDIDFSESITMVTADFDWGKIERRLKEMVKRHDEVFTSRP